MPSQTLRSDRAPRHPLRARLIAPPRARAANPDDSDLKLFALSFTAFFICIYTLIF
ncbi:hypothetical protein H5J25_07205 [Sphingomonas aliaeris]|uniref:Uncharacterized protein n=1 Tax=Sphingomonas aliaeris TaxID=2759526 RepID=A0A974NWZ9_9SPHN|nr:hypothetical protein [Sphingomonas aliaeris]QQV78425.1 hypothetical protein H5J25_07205 [Sphingomonas aliaeris]